MFLAGPDNKVNARLMKQWWKLINEILVNVFNVI